MKRALAALLFLVTASAVTAADKKIVFLAGGASHGSGDHEHRAGCLLFQSCLEKFPGVVAEVHSNGWPANPEAAFAGAAVVVIYSDGGGGHPFLSDNRLQTIGALMKTGVGLVCLHYAVEPTKEKGQQEFLYWIGGCFEQHWSVNPTWRAEFKQFPAHAITRGVKPFSVNDEWYFHMRFREGMEGVTPILASVAPASTMNRPDGPHSGNPAVRESVKRGEPQVLAWARVRPDGGRGFGFTGGHFHRNWANDDLRKLVLNAILWTAKTQVPAAGVDCKVTEEDLRRGLDRK